LQVATLQKRNGRIMVTYKDSCLMDESISDVHSLDFL
jgi:hypothetical protein